MTEISISVAIITRDRHEEILRQTLSALANQTMRPFEVVVVDTSTTVDLTNMIRAEFPEVQHFHLPDGPRSMPWSRNYAISSTHGNIVAFLDDDSLACPSWVSELTATYQADNSIGGVGGRVIEGMQYDGQLPPDGRKIGSFNWCGGTTSDFNTVECGTVEVGHIKGCNMSFRRDVLAAVGGFDEFYTLFGNREETDVCIRVNRGGHKLVYNPLAVVEHRQAGLYNKRCVRLEPMSSGYHIGKLEGYYVAKNFGILRWLSFYIYTQSLNLLQSIRLSTRISVRYLCYAFGAVCGLGCALKSLPKEPLTETIRRKYYGTDGDKSLKVKARP